VNRRREEAITSADPLQRKWRRFRVTAPIVLPLRGLNGANQSVMARNRRDLCGCGVVLLRKYVG
jgi:hypothetical protein